MFQHKGQLRYDHTTFERFLTIMRDKAFKLRTSKAPWLAEDVQRALFADAVRNRMTMGQWQEALSMVPHTKTSGARSPHSNWIADIENRALRLAGNGQTARVFKRPASAPKDAGRTKSARK